MAYGEAWDLFFDMGRERNLIPRSNGDLLAGVVSAGADVDQVDANFLQLLRKDRCLLKAPTHKASQRMGKSTEEGKPTRTATLHAPRDSYHAHHRTAPRPRTNPSR